MAMDKKNQYFLSFRWIFSEEKKLRLWVRAEVGNLPYSNSLRDIYILSEEKSM